jgi:hypothetical protein
VHKTGSITLLALLSLTPVAAGAQGDTSGAQRGAVSARAEPASVPASPVAVGSLDTLSLVALHMRLLDLERRRRDPRTELPMWIAFALVGVSATWAWQRVRSDERKDSTQAAKREETNGLLKHLLQPEVDKRLQEFVTKLENMAGQITDATSRADDTLRTMDRRLSEASQRLGDIKQTLDRSARADIHEADPSRPK